MKPKYQSGVVVGAGVVGLAIAAELAGARLCEEIWILEKESSFGQGTSSRNSEVIHAGIYYPPDSLKAQLCIEGRRRLYRLCSEHDIPHCAIGKLIVASAQEDLPELERIESNARACHVPLQEIPLAQIRVLEPSVRACGALFSPETGIVDSHSLMQFYQRQAVRHGAQAVFNTTVSGISHQNGRYLIQTQAAGGEKFDLESDVIVNSAGLYSDEVARLAGFDYRLHWCKGCYFSVDQSKARLCSHLIYPAVGKHAANLGVHVTFDLSGRMKLGPDVEYIDHVEDYSVPPERRSSFYAAAAQYLTFLEQDDLAPEMAGIRPKLQGPGEPFADFVIRQDREGFINCIGIESPGLTASPAIAAYVRRLLEG
ncbi:MAG TPA: NAD(P)/FAD-dependent oxidoreductase [Acidobacteriota bacterium]